MTLAQIGALLDGHVELDRSERALAITVTKLGMHGSADDIARFTGGDAGSGASGDFADVDEALAAFGLQEVPR